MNTTQSVTLTAALIGAVQVIKHIFGETQVSGFLTILAAVVLGWLAGATHIDGLPDATTGIMYAVAAIGTMSFASKISGS